jgi:hypothetical protein
VTRGSNDYLKADRIFSGKYSEDMWKAINNAETKNDLRLALYFVCCRLQELESRIEKTRNGNHRNRSA